MALTSGGSGYFDPMCIVTTTSWSRLSTFVTCPILMPSSRTYDPGNKPTVVGNSAEISYVDPPETTLQPAANTAARIRETIQTLPRRDVVTLIRRGRGRRAR